MNENKRNFEEEINATEALLYCLKRWRCVVIVMLIMATLAGGYKFCSVRKSNQESLRQWKEMDLEEPSVDGSNVLKAYQSLVEQNVKVEKRQGEYLNNSTLMQLDANHLQQGTLSYVVKTEESDHELSLQSTLNAAYRAYVTDGRLAKLIFSVEGDTAFTDSQYLLTFSYTATGPVLDTNDVTIDARQQAFFQIQILSPDEKSCAEQMKIAKQEMLAYSDVLQDQVGSHELTLLGSSISEIQSQTIQNYQTTVLNNYTSAVRNLNAIRTEAKSYAESIESEEDDSKELRGPVIVSPVQDGIKYGILGLILGAFLTVPILFIFFIMNDRLHSAKNFESRFGMHLLGRVIEPVKSKGLFGCIDRWLLRMGEGAYANLSYEEQIKILAANINVVVPAKEGKAHIMLAGTISTKDAGTVCVAVAEETKNVDFSGYRQLIFDASALDELNNYDGIIFIEKKEISSSNLIRQERRMALDREIRILGTIII